MLIEIKWSKYIKDKIYGQTTRFWYPILSSSTDLFSRKSEICCFALRVGRADSFPDFKGFPDFAMLDYSVHVTLFLCKHYIEEKICLM